MNFHIVHSVKGGCGKTMVALQLAADLSRKKDHRACMLDMDFRGTSLENQLFKTLGPNETVDKSFFDLDEKGLEVKISQQYYTHCFTQPSQPYEKSCISTVRTADMATKPFSLDLLLCDPSQASKEHFVSSVRPSEGLAVSTGLFRHQLRRIFGALANAGYTDLILDLSPSFDEYTRCIYNVLLSAEGESIDGSKQPVSLYCVSTFDIAHITAAGEYLNSVYYSNHYRERFPDATCVVLNDQFDDFAPAQKDMSTRKALMDMLQHHLERKLPPKEIPPGWDTVYLNGVACMESVKTSLGRLLYQDKAIPPLKEESRPRLKFHPYNKLFRHWSNLFCYSNEIGRSPLKPSILHLLYQDGQMRELYDFGLLDKAETK